MNRILPVAPYRFTLPKLPIKKVLLHMPKLKLSLWKSMRKGRERERQRARWVSGKPQTLSYKWDVQTNITSFYLAWSMMLCVCYQINFDFCAKLANPWKILTRYSWHWNKSMKFLHVNATKSYLLFGFFAGNAVLCSNFFCFFLVLRCLISFIKNRRIKNL